MEITPMVLIITMETYTLGKIAMTAVPKLRGKAFNEKNLKLKCCIFYAGERLTN